MALTRKMLKAMGIEDEKIDQIVEAHSETVDALKDKLRKAEEDSEDLKDVQKELDELKKKTSGADDWKKKYDDEKKAFDDYKKEIAGKETAASALLPGGEQFPGENHQRILPACDILPHLQNLCSSARSSLWPMTITVSPA